MISLLKRVVVDEMITTLLEGVGLDDLIARELVG